MALRFAQTYPVVLLARKPESYNDVVKDIKSAGGQAIGISADATDPNAISSALETVSKELPGSKLAAAVYNVGGGFTKKSFLDLKLEELDSGLDASV